LIFVSGGRGDAGPVTSLLPAQESNVVLAFSSPCQPLPLSSHGDKVEVLGIENKAITEEDFVQRLQLFPAANLYFFCLTPFSVSK